jgi:chromosome segregation ATPase
MSTRDDVRTKFLEHLNNATNELCKSETAMGYLRDELLHLRRLGAPEPAEPGSNCTNSNCTAAEAWRRVTKLHGRLAAIEEERDHAQHEAEGKGHAMINLQESVIDLRKRVEQANRMVQDANAISRGLGLKVQELENKLESIQQIARGA